MTSGLRAGGDTDPPSGVTTYCTIISPEPWKMGRLHVVHDLQNANVHILLLWLPLMKWCVSGGQHFLLFDWNLYLCSFRPISPVTLMGSIGCGGCSWHLVSERQHCINILGFPCCCCCCSPPLLDLSVVWSFNLSSVWTPGFMLFIRGFVNYSRVRKLADPTYATLPRTRVLFIY